MSCNKKSEIQVEFNGESLRFEGDFGTQVLRKFE